MRDTAHEAARLLERAQSGQARQVLDLDLADHAAFHFVRAIAIMNLPDGEADAVLAELELSAATAERDRNAGWQACAIASRASHLLRCRDAADYHLDTVLRDLVAAETLVAEETCPIAIVNARVAIAIGYSELRLYELVGPHYDIAYEMSPTDNGNRAMWLYNQAELHLSWALELYQIGQVAAAEGHTATAERYALRAADEADGDDADAWRENALLAAACARADREDPAGAAADIEHYLAVLEKRGISSIALAYSRPFHAVALSRSGRAEEALALLDRAVTDLPAEAGWLIAAATHRTRAVLLVARGSAEAAVGLTYGDSLATVMWRQRQSTLHTVTTMKSLDQTTRAAELDALTGIANRGAFDRAVARAQTGPDEFVTVLLVDTDKFKEINDTAGHAAGDAALREIARRLAGHLRAEDLLARLGGDEFAALLPGVDPETAAQVAARMVEAIRAIPDCPATLSIGVAGAPATDLPDTLRRADEAMYRVKRRGGDGVEVHSRMAAMSAAG